MKQEFNLIAEFRDDQGKGASRRLRHHGKSSCNPLRCRA